MIERIAHAKINLALHVTGQRDDGYHLLDSIVVFTDYGDLITVKKPHHPHGPLEFMVDGPFGDNLSQGGDNLVVSAAVLLRETLKSEGLDPEPVSISLTKNLPIASGIGGGSADAAATLLALSEYWNCELDLLPLAKALGADVAMCLSSVPLRAKGIGDDVSILESGTCYHIVLVNPSIEVSTPSIFKALAEKNNPPIGTQANDVFPSIENLLDMRNDLEATAIVLAPQIQHVLEQLSKTDPLLVRMSGSGATCFALYQSVEAARQAAEEIICAHPNWWCVATSTTVA